MIVIIVPLQSHGNSTYFRLSLYKQPFAVCVPPGLVDLCKTLEEREGVSGHADKLQLRNTMKVNKINNNDHNSHVVIVHSMMIHSLLIDDDHYMCLLYYTDVDVCGGPVCGVV